MNVCAAALFPFWAAISSSSVSLRVFHTNRLCYNALKRPSKLDRKVCRNMLLRNVILIALGFHIMLNLTRPVLSLYASQLGAGTAEIGMLTAAYAFFPLVLAIHIGKITDFLGDRIPSVLGSIGLTVGVAFPFIFPHMWSLYVSQAIVGISQIFINISLQNVIGNAATEKNRDHYFSMFSMTVALGGVIGPVSGGYLAEHFSYPLVFLVSTVIGFVPVAFSFLLPHLPAAKEKTEPEKGSAFQLLKLPLLRKALFTSALALYSRDIFVIYFPLFANESGMSASVIGWIITVQGIAMVSVRFFLSRLTAKAGRDRVLLASILAAGIAFLLVPLSGNALLMGVICALMGAGLGCGQPLSMSITYNASPKTRTGEVLGLRLASNRLSQLLAPLFFGLVGSWAGLASVFFVSGTFLIGGAYLSRGKTDPDQAG
jgi:MFS family permease